MLQVTPRDLPMDMNILANNRSIKIHITQSFVWSYLALVAIDHRKSVLVLSENSSVSAGLINPLGI
jgi:hypothetical protein